jgi:hypothetical protein
VPDAQSAGSLTEADSDRETVSQKRGRPVDDPSRTSRASPKKFWSSIAKLSPISKKVLVVHRKNFRPSPKKFGHRPSKKIFSVH